MEATRIAAELLEAVPANATLGLRVLTAVEGVGEVEIAKCSKSTVMPMSRLCR